MLCRTADVGHTRPNQDDLDRADTTLRLNAPFVFGGQHLGRLDLGLPTARLRQARSDYLRRSLLISVLALLLSMALLAALAVAVTRHLRALSQASRRLAECEEDESTLQILRELEVDLVQGFHRTRPSSHVFAPSPCTLLRPPGEFNRAARPH